MKDYIENKISKAVENSAPDVLDKVLEQCEKGKVIKMDEKKNMRSLKLIGSVAAAVLIVVVGAVNFLDLGGSSTVFLDVNPSIKFDVNNKDRVRDAEALNEDAEKIMEGMDLEDTDLEVAVNALIGSMLKNGYLSDLNNSVLVSVDNKNENKSMELRDKIAGQISDTLGTAKLDAAVLSQSVSKASAKSEELCEKYGISKGKAELISCITKNDPTLTEEKLAGLTINELNLIMKGNDIRDEKIVAKGDPSDKQYIGEEKAEKIAVKYIGIDKKDIEEIEVSLDTENNELVYEVEIETKSGEYEIYVNAVDGSVVADEFEDKDRDESVTREDVISESEAKDIISEEFGIPASEIGEISLDEDDDKPVFEAEFTHENREYSVKIDAVTGKILEKEIDDADDDEDDEDDEDDDKKADIKKSEAVRLVLEKLDMSEDEADRVDIDLEDDEGKLYYEAEVTKDGREYEYIIDAKTGSIMLKDSEEDDDSDDEFQNAKLTKEEALNKALESLGIKRADITDLEIEIEDEDGKAFYEISFKNAGKEYSVHISLEDGKVLSSEIDDDDDD